MLDIQSLDVSYSKKQVLHQLNLKAEKGAIHGILGRNGAGKTTLFRTIFGFKKPLAGSITLEGRPLEQKSIAFLETENYFYPYMKGLEYLQLIHNDAEAIERYNKLFQLPLDQFASEYSTGMKKKLALIGALLLDRPLLILDEPFNGVDLESNEKICLLLERLKADKYLLVSSHILGTLTSICDRISVLDEGKILKTWERKEFEVLEKELKEEIQAKMDQAFGE
jgi:ABC-2 type transport system ATP-binding protein